MIEQEKDWYTQKELVTMIQDVKEEMHELRLEMRETKMLIRDYNNLRKRLDDCEKRVNQIYGQSQGGKDMWGYVVGGIGLFLAILSYVMR